MDANYLTVQSQGQFADPGLDGAHDPTIVIDTDGAYVMASTDTAVAGSPGVGAQLRRSLDLVDWSWWGHAFEGVPNEAKAWTNASGIWAPEVVKRGAEYRMYYSASSFGSRTSAIALATAPSARGPWVDRGIVVATSHDASEVNAIDAAVVADREGNDWLCYGSFFGGLRILPLGVAGYPRTQHDPGVPIARRAASITGAIEGGHILYNAPLGSYYLFTSYDSLFETYHVRVARSASVTGEYVDAAGRSMLDSSEPPTTSGNILLGSHVDFDGVPWLAPGHSSHLSSTDGDFLVHHVRYGAEPDRHTAQIRQLGWTVSGWPVCSPTRWGGRPVGLPHLDAGAQWRVIKFQDDDRSMIRPKPAQVILAEPDAMGRLALTVDGEPCQGVAFRDVTPSGDISTIAAIDGLGQTRWLRGNNE